MVNGVSPIHAAPSNVSTSRLAGSSGRSISGSHCQWMNATFRHRWCSIARRTTSSGRRPATSVRYPGAPRFDPTPTNPSDDPPPAGTSPPLGSGPSEAPARSRVLLGDRFEVETSEPGHVPLRDEGEVPASRHRTTPPNNRDDTLQSRTAADMARWRLDLAHGNGECVSACLVGCRSRHPPRREALPKFLDDRDAVRHDCRPPLRSSIEGAAVAASPVTPACVSTPPSAPPHPGDPSHQTGHARGSPSASCATTATSPAAHSGAARISTTR